MIESLACVRAREPSNIVGADQLLEGARSRVIHMFPPFEDEGVSPMRV